MMKRFATILTVIFVFSGPLFAGSITGKIMPPKSVRSVTAIDRTREKTFHGTFHKTSGEFVFADLPGGTYDLAIETSRLKFEGVDLTLGEGEDSKLPLRNKDIEWLVDWVSHVKAFMNKKTVLAVRGNGKHCKALVDLLRDRAFHSAKGDEVIWRLETWTFDKFTGAWVKRGRGGVTVLYRKRMSREAFQKMRNRWRFTPELGGISLTKTDKIRLPVIDLKKLATPKPLIDRKSKNLREESLDDAIIRD